MCDEGYSPTGEMTTVCTANGNWEPNPADTECVIREGEVNDNFIQSCICGGGIGDALSQTFF